MKQRKVIRRIILFGFFILPIGTNAIWAAGGPEWLYWASRLIFDAEIISLGIVFTFLPRIFLVIFDDLSWEDKIASKRHFYSVLLGLILTVFGIYLFSILVRSWSIECVDIMLCVR